MQFYSTNNPTLRENLKSAVLQGLAADKGLYMPENIPLLPAAFWNWLPGKSMGEIGFEVLKHFFCPDIPEPQFKMMVEEAFDFPVPLKNVSDRIQVLELFHGPTLAFKDVGARFLARVMSYFADLKGNGIQVLVATSGDTGSAVAQGFYRVPGVQVHILYPSGLVSSLQELQFASLADNITAYEVDGTFDDCQRMVKEAFMDGALRNQLILTSANSINLARFLPQSVYYFHALAQMDPELWPSLVFSVPSGNLGNLTAGLIAWKMGMPIRRFVAANNANRVFSNFIEHGLYAPHPSVATMANAMDVGDPSNFSRIENLFGGEWLSMKAVLSGLSFSDDEIAFTIKRTWHDTGYLLDPHGATGYAALQHALQPNERGIFLATAHPAKFNESVSAVIEDKVDIPDRLAKFLLLNKKSVKINTEYKSLKTCLLSHAHS